MARKPTPTDILNRFFFGPRGPLCSTTPGAPDGVPIPQEQVMSRPETSHTHAAATAKKAVKRTTSGKAKHRAEQLRKWRNTYYTRTHALAKLGREVELIKEFGSVQMRSSYAAIVAGAKRAKVEAEKAEKK